MNAIAAPATAGNHGLSALLRLWRLAQADHGGSRVAVKLLLGLYNGDRFPFDLTELRCLDDAYLEDALTVIRMDATPRMEVHAMLNLALGRDDCGPRFELLAHNWKLKGRCKREYLGDLQARVRPMKLGDSGLPLDAGAAAFARHKREDAAA